MPSTDKRDDEADLVVVVDCGHGGTDAGSVVEGVREKDITLQLGLLLARMLRERGAMVYLTRQGDSTLDLDQRTTFANNIPNASLLVSLHANYAPNKNISGIETYCLAANLFKQTFSNNITAAQQKVIDRYRSERYNRASVYARAIHQELLSACRKKDPNVVDRKVKNAVFQVMAGTCMPAILIEIGYLSNEKERKRIVENLETIAGAIAAAVVKVV